VFRSQYRVPITVSCSDHSIVFRSQCDDQISQIRNCMFKVQAKGFSQEFDRWVDALATAKSLQPKCGWFDEVRILEKGELVWSYSRGYKYPRYFGAGVYDRLARRFALEMTTTAIPDPPPTAPSPPHTPPDDSWMEDPWA
jgi:hypothetical protein